MLFYALLAFVYMKAKQLMILHVFVDAKCNGGLKMKPKDLSENINSAEQIVSAIEMFAVSEKCALKHEPGVEVPIASVVVTQPFGVEGGASECVQIPLCEECARWWVSGESDWVLMFCVDCGESQWVFKPLSKREWNDSKVLWLFGCLECGKVKADRVCVG